jgi:hypothetical protein
MTSVTIKAYPSAPFHTVVVFLGTTPGAEPYWDVMAHLLSQYPFLDEQGISAYTTIAPNFASTDMGLVDGFLGIYILPSLHPENTSESLTAVINKLFNNAIAPYPTQFFTYVTPSSYPDFWAYYKDNNGPSDGGHDQIIGSRLLDKKALTTNLTALKEAYRSATPPGTITSPYLVSGRGVHNAKIRGGSNAVNPAWRKAYIHNGICIMIVIPLGILTASSTRCQLDTIRYRRAAKTTRDFERKSKCAPKSCTRYGSLCE